MALVVADRVKETTTTTGTGAYTLAGAETGFESFSAIGNGNMTYYCCTDGTDFEVGIGTYTASGTTLARTTILQSSNSDAAVNWTSGTRDIFCTQPAEKAFFLDDDDVARTEIIELAGGVTYDPPGTGGSETATDVAIALQNQQRIVLGYNGYIRNIIDAEWGSPLEIAQSNTSAFSSTRIFGGATSVQLFYNTSKKLQTASDGVEVLATGEDPAKLILRSDDPSPTDWDFEGIIDFEADDDGGTSVNYARISGRTPDVSAGTFDSYLYFHTMEGGTLAETVFLTPGGQLGLNKANPRFSFWQPALSGGSRSSFSMDLMPPTDLRADRDIRFPDGSGTLMLNRGDGELNNTVENFQQDFSSGSYFTTGEYIEIASISPTGSSRNYNISGKIMAQASNNAQILDINVGIRFNSSGSFGATILYNSSQMDTDWVEPVLWTNTSTDNIKLVIQAKTGNIHNLGVDLTLIQRGGYNDITWNTTEVQTDTTTVPTGYTEYIGEKAIGSVVNGAVELYHNNVKRFQTQSNGFGLHTTDVSVEITDQNSFGAVEIGGSAGALIDLKRPKTDDYDMRFSVTSSDGSTGNIISDDLHLRSKTGEENYLDATLNGAVNLYYDNNLRLNTTTDGVTVTGGTGPCNFVILADTDNSNEDDVAKLTLRQDGNNVTGTLGFGGAGVDNPLILTNVYTGAGTGGGVQIKLGSEFAAKFNSNAGAELYYDGSEALTTASSGIVTTSPVLTNGGDLGDARALFTHTIVGNNPSNIQYVKIATLPATNNGTLDHLTIEGQVGGWTLTTAGFFKISFSRRGSFSYFYDAYGDIQTIAAIQAYQQADGTVQIWGKLNATTYTKLSYSIPHSFQVTIEENPSLTETAPSGTLVFDSSSSTYAPRFQVDDAGNLSATTKSFDIAHPTKDGMRLRYGSLEGPENGVYVRGRLTGSSVIKLPEHWAGLVDEDSITVQLTAIGKSQDLWVEDVSIEQVKVCDANTDCFYMVMAERIDVAKLEVEYAN